MIHSMTGYGKHELNLKHANFTIELKSLNSKQLDTNIKILSIYRDKEIDLRNLLSKKLQRGKIELSVWKEKVESSFKYCLNTTVIKDYYKQIQQLKKELGTKENMLNMKSFEADLIPSLLKMPDVIQKGEDKADENEWNEIINGIDIAINNLLQYRLDEGAKLEEDVSSRVNKINMLLNQIPPFAEERIINIKRSLSEKLAEIDNKNIDENRLEQELIYYLEKQDITEEQVRLKTHLDYFLEVIVADFPNGKKLGFIAQEIGREINTIGSKSSNADMQKIVVQMKDELEKIKEQLLNIL
jgi:uncharacterized protein (TIGR00255 family)